MLWVLLAGFLVGYGGVYAAVMCKLESKTPERYTADRWLCCWREIYHGKAFCLYNVLFSPLILFVHSVRIYFCHCAAIYCRRLFWLACGCCTSYYTDPDFGPDVESVGDVRGDTANAEAGHSDADVIWVRASDFSKGDVRQKPARPHLQGTDMCLFEGKIEAKDILQGALGDCWLLAAMATLSEHEGAIARLFLSHEVDPRGKYYIRLYDPQVTAWKVVAIDDRVPCEADPHAVDGVRRGVDGWPEARYARPHGKEIWAMLLEKAFAKLCGSYAAIEAGITEWGILCMTGGSAWRYEVTDQGTWERNDLVIIGDPKDKRACAFRPTAERHDSGELFELLRYYHRHGAVLCCGGVKAKGTAQGLVQQHAFSLLQVRTARKHWDSDQYFRFVQVRNPWGSGEWTGPWSDNSPEWELHPHVRQQLCFEGADDGTYWMQWHDFCQYWSYVGCVDMSIDIHSMHPPLHKESEPTGPLKAFLSGCSRYWCMCAGLRHLTMAHQATTKQLQAQDFHSTCGLDPSGAYCRVCEQELVYVDGRGGKILSELHELHVRRSRADAVQLVGSDPQAQGVYVEQEDQAVAPSSRGSLCQHEVTEWSHQVNRGTSGRARLLGGA